MAFGALSYITTNFLDMAKLYLDVLNNLYTLYVHWILRVKHDFQAHPKLIFTFPFLDIIMH